MNNFTYHVYTDVRFGKNQINTLPELMAPLGKKILLVYGGGSIKKSGIYDKIYELLPDCEIFELSGIEPNPKIESVRAGAELCKEHGIEAVSYTHLRAHETRHDLVCRLLLEKKKK